MLASEAAPEVAEVEVPETSVLATLGSIFCCLCIFYNMYQAGGESTSMSGMNNQDL